MWDLVSLNVYLFYYVFFINFYYVYLEMLNFKICNENFAKSKWEKQKEIEGIFFIIYLLCVFRDIEI